MDNHKIISDSLRLKIVESNRLKINTNDSPGEIDVILNVQYPQRFIGNQGF